MADDDRELDALYIDSEHFRHSPQVGVPIRQEWPSFAACFARPSTGEDKGAVGGYALGRYRENTRRKSNLIEIGAVSLDFDESGADAVARALARYRAIVHETFSSTADAPRCRAIVLLAEPIDVATYDALHAVMRARFRRAGLPPDEGAKDCSRLNYSPVRRSGAGYAYRVTQGEALDARGVLAAQPPPPARSAPRLVAPEHADRYVAGALRRAADAVAGASPGGRHHELSREAFRLARLDLPENEIRAALLGPFVAAAGEPRRREGERTIADAVRARRGAAS
jgi:hypothetical protein